MADEITATEYAEIAGVPLATPAWRALDLSELYDSPPIRGSDRMVPYHEGDAIPLRRSLASSRRSLRMIFNGEEDREGNAHSSVRAGLLANIDEFKSAVCRPRQNTQTGLVTINHYLADGSTRRAQGRVIPPLQLGAVGPTGWRGTLDLSIPGLFRSVATTDFSATGIAAQTDVTLPNPGTADQFETVITLTGTATQVRLANLSWDSGGDTYLEFLGSLSPSVIIDTGDWTALRGASSVVGAVSHSGHERWLPLLPGDNTIRITPTGGTVSASFSHYAPWL